MIRFIGYICIAFVTAFVGVSWATRGFPTDFSNPMSAGSSSSMPALVSSHFGDDSAKDFERKNWEAKHTSQSDKNPTLDKLRMETLQAATAYALSPCDRTIKQNLIAALTAYTRAWQSMLDCFRPMGMLMMCGEDNLQRAAAAFSTPLDKRVKEALDQAFERQGILQSEFPAAVRFDMLQFAGPNLWSDEAEKAPVCYVTTHGSLLKR